MLVHFQSFRAVLLFIVQCAQVPEGAVVFWLHIQQLFKHVDRIIIPLKVVVGLAEVEISFYVRGVQIYDPFEILNGSTV